MISKHSQYITPFIAIIAFPFLSWNPSILTFLSLLSSVLFFVGILTHLYLLSIISILGFLFDVIDGFVARRSGKVSAFGGFLDSVFDRIGDFFLITSFGFAHLVSWELIVIVLFTSFLISYMRNRGDLAFGLGHEKVGGIMQRPQRIIFILVGFFIFLFKRNLNLLFWVFVIIFILNCITILQRFWEFKKKV